VTDCALELGEFASTDEHVMRPFTASYRLCGSFGSQFGSQKARLVCMRTANSPRVGHSSSADRPTVTASEATSYILVYYGSKEALEIFRGHEEPGDSL